MPAESKTQKTQKVQSAPVAPPVVAPVAQPAQPAPAEKKTRKPREPVTKESLLKHIQDSITEYEAKLAEVKENSEKSPKATRILSSFINKTLKPILSEYKRAMKMGTKRHHNSQSGFMKPIRISQALADFLGWDVNQTYCRNNVTKEVCKYVKDNNLQDPNEKKHIIPDAAMQALGIKTHYTNKKGEQDRMTFFGIQKSLSSHYFKVEEPATEPASE
jgi:chromatin remodeling complex protein RSC6